MISDLHEPLSMDQIIEIIFNTPGFFLCESKTVQQEIISPDALKKAIFGSIEKNLWAKVKDNVRIAYRDRGQGDPLVLIHGMRDSKHVMEPLVDRLSKKMRVISLDLRGHGYSDRPDGEYTTASMAADVIGLLDLLGIQKAHLAGHSLGACVAFEAAVLSPAKTGKIVVMGSAIKEKEPQYRPTNPEEMHRDKSPAKHVPVLKMLDKKFFPIENRSVSRKLIETLRTKILLGWMMLPERTSLSLAKLKRTNLEDAVYNLDHETLVLVGSLDIVGKPSDAAFIKERLKNATVEIIQDAGHYMFLEQTTTTAEKIIGFLRA